MKKFVTLLLVLGMCSVVSAGTMVISGLPTEDVDSSGGPVSLTFDIVSDGQLDDSSHYIYTYNGGTLDMAGGANLIVPGELYDDSELSWLGDLGVDVTDVSLPIIWADCILIKSTPEVIVGPIITGLGLTIAQGFEGPLEIKVLGEISGEGVGTVNVIPEPVTIALLGLGGLFLRRRK